MFRKKMILLSIIAVIALVISPILYQANLFASAYYKGEKSEFFDGERFKRIGDDDDSAYNFSIWKALGYFTGLSKDKNLTWEEWEDEEVFVKQAIPEERVLGDTIRYYFINHSTVLIQTNGLNIITDPIYSQRAGIFMFGPKRVHLPGIAFENLPKIDIILLSHDHYDHFNNETLKKLYKRDNPLVITPAGNDYLLKKLNKNFRVAPLLWGESTTVGNVKITLTKAYHWSRRGLNDMNKALWGGFIVQTPTKTIYFAGDTSFGNENGAIFKEIHEKFPNIDLAFLPIGAYLPYDFMRKGHTSPEDAVNIHRLLHAKKSVAVHFGTFQLSAEKRLQPVEDLEIAKKKHNLGANEFITLQPGEFGEIK
ncbi:MAG: MBL fold metallo-hydrolase [Alphaproteobacteria bacterium]|jgi:L-ascorbate metabolism protein UlaG (beta-lactamase superfamily)|nr:MBL fold metallo-hydrolase [Alphaproteobacteria bacterium]